jgi:hypothetical protein
LLLCVNKPWEPPRLYSWTVLPAGGDGPGAVGVTDDMQRALEHAGEALRAAPAGARGLVHRVARSFARVGYHYDRLIARGSFDPDSGLVAWEEQPPRRGGLDALLAGAAVALGDSVPPEAVAASFADFQTAFTLRLQTEHANGSTSHLPLVKERR